MKKIIMNKTVMPNGLRVITVYKDTDIFSMGLGIKLGSLYENEGNSGISHLIEHMLFKGTDSRDGEKLNDEIEMLAGDFDIYTTYDQTVLTVNIMKDKAEECMELISDMLMNSVFPQKAFNLEKKVIIEEIKMSRDDAEDLAYLGLYKAAFPDRYSKYNIAGTIKSIRGIKREDAVEFYKSYYVPDNVAICIVSPYTHKEILNMIDKYFSTWQKGNAKKLSKENYTVEGKKIIRHKKGISQTHVLYGFDIQHLSRREEVALALINKKIGAGANSILFKELRDKRGYAYSVYSDMDLTTNINMFYIYAGISIENLKETLNVIDNIVLRFKNGDINFDDEGIRLIKNIFLTDMAIALESSSHIVDYLLNGELEYGNPMEYESSLSIMDTIDRHDIKAVINKILKDPIIYILAPS